MSDPARDHLNRPLRTLRECAVWQRNFRLTCWQCRHSVVLEGICLWWLAERRQWGNDPVALFARKFYCAPCFEKSGKAVKTREPYWRITEEQPTADHIPAPPVSEWKRLVSRYRS